MAECSVFECGICTDTYNDYCNIPLSLPWGHVFWKSWMSKYCPTGNICCPSDKQVFPITYDQLPYCYAILMSLPQKQQTFMCSNHPRKRIKYMCKVHGVYLCSDCVLTHTGSGHEVVAAKVTHDDARKELQILHDSTNKASMGLRRQMNSQHIKERNIDQFYEAQISLASSAFEQAVQKLTLKKKQVIDTLNKHMRENKNNWESFKMNASSQVKSLKNMSHKIEEFAQSLDQRTYEEFAYFMQETRVSQRAIPMSEWKFYQFTGGITLGEMPTLTQVQDSEVVCIDDENCQQEDFQSVSGRPSLQAQKENFQPPCKGRPSLPVLQEDFHPPVKNNRPSVTQEELQQPTQSRPSLQTVKKQVNSRYKPTKRRQHKRTNSF